MVPVVLLVPTAARTWGARRANGHLHCRVPHNLEGSLCSHAACKLGPPTGPRPLVLAALPQARLDASASAAPLLICVFACSAAR